jgi:two-component system nitrogen regulation response regulator NtrX
LSKPRILVIDDEAAIRDSLRMILEYENYEFSGAASGPDGIAAIKREAPDMVILDIKMAGMSGLDTLAEIRKLDEAVPVAMISGHGTITDAMQATRLGAFDFIEKPFTSERVLVTVAKGLEVRELRQENRELKLAMESKYEIVGQSAPLRQVLEAVKRAAPTNATVMLLGESGVGKELVARTIHRNSPRAGQRFVQVNCAAIPEELIESELFGHEKGSFTGATEKQIGKFEQADRGTIFLDEVGDMSPKTQAKVLRVLQEQEVERLGSARTIKVDVRVIAATNKNLEEAIQRGEFREDLFFRLNVIPMTVPPLRAARASRGHPPSRSALREAGGRRAQHQAEAVRSQGARGDAALPVAGQYPRASQRGRAADDHDGGRRGARGGPASGPSRRGRSAGTSGARGIPGAVEHARRRHAPGVQRRRRARLSRPETARERLEHLQDGGADRHSPQQLVQKAGTIRHKAGS